MNLTIRNIPDDIINKIKDLSKLEKRSINSEILMILEKGLSIVFERKTKNQIGKDTQIEIWKELNGQWKDDRSTKEIIDDIVSNRTKGRDIEL